MMGAFLQACGIYPALEYEVEAAEKAPAIRYCLHQPFAVVGRHPAADIYLDVDGVRPRHVYLQAIEGRVACINVSQTGSILIDDEGLETFCWLSDSQTIQVSSQRMKLLPCHSGVKENKTTVADPLAAGSAHDIYAPEMILEITNDEVPDTVMTWKVDRLLTLVGRSRRSAIRLEHENISNVHCSLVLTTAGLWVVDLLGRGGIFLNEQPVRAGCLGMEDELRLGPFRLRLQQQLEQAIHPVAESAFRELTPADDFELAEALPDDEHLQVRNYHTPWPANEDQAEMLEAMMDHLQNMQGPIFEQNQHLLPQMLDAFSHQDLDQQKAEKKELERLCQNNQTVESNQQKKQSGAARAGITLPKENMIMQATNSSVSHNAASVTLPVRSASSLLKDSDSSVFRIPTKTGDLYEKAGNKESASAVDASSSSWLKAETDLLTPGMVESAKAFARQYAEQKEGICYGYDPNQHDRAHLNSAEFSTIKHADHASHLPAADRSSDAHRWQQACQEGQQMEKLSIWKKLSKFFFGKSGS